MTIQMAKRVRITNSRLNSYGTRILTQGVDIEQYQRNPVLLYMHSRGKVIGYLKDIRVENDEITGEPVFDEASELSVQAKKQWEFGSVRMVSAGLTILELSDDPQYLTQGQTRPTVTRSKLIEVSIVDIGANDDAIRLHRDGKYIELGHDGESQLPFLKNFNQNIKEMKELKQIALMLGLAEDATEEQILAKIKLLLAASTEVEALKKEKDNMILAAVTSAVDTAIKENRLAADRKQQFIELGQKIGVDSLKSTLEAMNPAARITSVISPGAPAAAEYKKLSEVPADELKAMRENDKATYMKLYRAEYGIDCEL